MNAPLESARLRSTIEKRRTIAQLRALLLIAMGALLLQAGAAQAGAGALVLLGLYTASILVMLAVPLHLVRSVSFESAVGSLDLVAVGCAIGLAGVARGALPVSCLLLALLLAVASSRIHAAAGVAAICAVHAWSLLAISAASLQQLGTETLFVASLGLYYGYLAEGIHHMRSRERVERFSVKELRTLLEILETIGGCNDLGQITKVVVRKISEIVPSVRCSMLFIDKTRTRCFVMASHDAPDLSMLELSLEKYPEVRRAIETKSPVLVENIGDDPLMADVRETLRHLDLQSIMVVPMVLGDDLLGTLCMKTARASQPFSERELNFCAAVARASAGALKNAALNREVAEASNRQRMAADQLARVVEHSPDLILTTDGDCRITEFNRAAQRLLGFSREQALGAACTTLLGDEVAQLVPQTLAAGLVTNRSCRLRKADGGWLDVELSTAVLRDEAGSPTGTVWLGRDVSELKAAHRRLLQAERLSTVGEVIAGVAHELNNPLSGVLGYSQLLLARHGDSTLRRELERIHDSALRCQKIVGNLLAFARVQKPERRWLGVNGIIEKTLEIKRYQLRVHNIEVVREFAPDLPRTLLDFHQIQQVLLNLFNNAQYAITAAASRSGRLTIRTAHDEGWIRVEVQDNGTGMDPATLERIFDPFFTTKDQGVGTGLGLSVSYGIVEEHGGRIQARSRRGQGSTFVIDLPVCAEPAVSGEGAESVRQAQTAAPVASGERILIVDDEPLILDLLVEVLDERGYGVDTASSGEEATRKLDAQRYDLVISDVRMPRMTGLELYQMAIARQPHLEGRVLFITGDLVERDTVEFLAQIHARILAKPLDIESILGEVQGLLRPVGLPA